MTRATLIRAVQECAVYAVFCGIVYLALDWGLK